MLRVGDRLPEATFFTMTPEGLGKRTTREAFADRKVALFAVPGAFTPTCSKQHLPGFLAQVDDFLNAGIDAVVCLSVNDAFVLDAWAKHTGAAGRIEFLADPYGDFARESGLYIDRSERGMGWRAARCAMLVDDGIVEVLLIEDAPQFAQKSSAEALLAAISDHSAQQPASAASS
jgi:glutaredoxin/glutathione-dependent peroxiredoxin